MTDELLVLLGDTAIGHVERDARNELRFIYEAPYRDARNAIPLSLSMPLARAEHGHDVIEPFLWNLLPDNELIIERWARRFQVSSRSAFSLIAAVGEDCAGAIRFVTPERVGALPGEGTGDVQWLTPSDVGRRLRALRDDASSWRQPEDGGQFSLAGAQPKTALLRQGKRWGVPTGRHPTTHILKPGALGLDGHAENEHLCLLLARELGLPTATSELIHFGDEVAVVVERYDRIQTDSGIVRVHQEDACQVLGLHPARKYQNEGGPGVSSIAHILRQHSRSASEDMDTFVDALALNWLIGGTDAHAKNYSFLIGAEGTIRLAPLYDVASALPYPSMPEQKLKLAMKIGGKYRLRDIGLYEWEKLAAELSLDADSVVQRVANLALRVPDLASTLHAREKQAGLTHPVVDRLVAALCQRAKKCATAMYAGARRRR
jgi:serine/threonine-protein kinase HipA